MTITADYDFDDYGLGIVGEAALIGAVRGLLREAFVAFADEAEWWFTEMGGDHHPEEVTHLWLSARYPGEHWSGELPLHIELTPDEMQAAMLRSIDELMCNDAGEIEADEKADVLRSLTAWRAALDAVEQAVNAKPVAAEC